MREENEASRFVRIHRGHPPRSSEDLPTVQQCKDRISYLYTNKRQSLVSNVFVRMCLHRYGEEVFDCFLPYTFCQTLSRWRMTNFFEYEYEFMDGFNQISIVLFCSILICKD